MKLSNLLLFAGSAVGSYLLVKNREVITEEVIDIKEYQEDLTYKFKALEKDFQARLAVIKELRETEEN